MEVGKHLATLSIPEMRRQLIYAFFEDDSTLARLPPGMREMLEHEVSEGSPPLPPESARYGSRA